MPQYVLITGGTIDAEVAITGSFYTPYYEGGNYGVCFAQIDAVICGIAFQAQMVGTGENETADYPTFSITTPAGILSSVLPVPMDDPTGLMSGLDGTISISIPYDLVIDIEPLGTTQPFFNGVPDSPAYQSATLGLFQAGAITYSMTFAGGLETGTQYIPLSGITEITPSLMIDAFAQSDTAEEVYNATGPDSGYWTYQFGSSPGNTSISVSATVNMPSSGVESEGASVSYVDPTDPMSQYCSGSASAGPGSASAVTTAAAYATASCSWGATRSFDLSGVIRAMEASYPDGLPANLTVAIGGTTGGPFVVMSGGFDTGPQSQQSWSTGAYATAGTSTDLAVVTNGPNTGNASTFSPISVTLPSGTSSPLAMNGDDTSANRVLLHGPTCDGMTIAQAPSYEFEYWTSGTVAGIGLGSGTVSGGLLTITTSSGSGTGGVTRSYSPPVCLSSYRYLQFTLTPITGDNTPLRVGIGDYHWNISTGLVSDGSTTITLDLCAPSDGAETSDIVDTHWPMPTPTAQQTALFGPYVVYGITFDEMPPSCEVTIGSLSMVAVAAATVDCLPTLYDSTYDPDSETVSPDWPTLDFSPGTVYVRRFFLANSDGRQTVEEYDISYDGGSFDLRSITDLTTSINANDVGPTLIGTLRWPGWTATPDVPTATGATGGSGILEAVGNLYTGPALLATYLYGGGALALPAGSGPGGSGWSYGFDLSLGEIPAQITFDQITLCGMEGDIFGFGGSSGSDMPGTITYLRASLITRASAHGIALTADGEPATNVWITMKQGGTTVSSATTESPSGRYHMARPTEAYVPPGIAYIQAPCVPTTPFSVSPLYTRHRSRASLQAPSFPPPTPPDLYFPFPMQFSDPSMVPVEEWRRVPSEQTGPPGTPDTPAPSGGSPAGGAAGPGGGGG